MLIQENAIKSVPPESPTHRLLLSRYMQHWGPAFVTIFGEAFMEKTLFPSSTSGRVVPPVFVLSQYMAAPYYAGGLTAEFYHQADRLNNDNTSA